MVEEKDIRKTGTTTVAMVCKDGAVLCADKRVTSGYLVAYKKYEKIVQITDNIAVTVAGTVSDVQLLTKLLKAELKLKDLRTNRTVTVKEAVNLLSSMVYNNIRKMSMIPGISHFIVGGNDSDGVHVYDIGADGSVTYIDDYTSSGSGSVMAYGVLETLYKKDMTVEEGVKLGAKAINAAVQRDIASGNGIDIISITKDGVKKVLSKLIEFRIEA
ncbi:MAG: proteasome subunit beta [Nanoarchaeota archaeon]|nr:proteasome subunit beta [Nanoarchaeota archaeon]MBU1005888.1 proteasome subunit beta [Nanoarchaeota archaeon]MBU1945422.1 proteasome subunit beta [Nanoarchaeota archaeon]